MGKKLIIKGADFSEHAILPAFYLDLSNINLTFGKTINDSSGEEETDTNSAITEIFEIPKYTQIIVKNPLNYESTVLQVTNLGSLQRRFSKTRHVGLTFNAEPSYCKMSIVRTDESPVPNNIKLSDVAKAINGDNYIEMIQLGTFDWNMIFYRKNMVVTNGGIPESNIKGVLFGLAYFPTGTVIRANSGYKISIGFSNKNQIPSTGDVQLNKSSITIQEGYNWGMFSVNKDDGSQNSYQEAIENCDVILP